MRVTITLDDVVGELLKLGAAEAHESLSQHIAARLVQDSNRPLLARVRDRAEATGVPLSEVVERLLLAYAEGKVNVAPKAKEPPASTPSPPPPAKSPFTPSVEETPPDPDQFQSDLMRRMARD